ncbi:hypothetical protein A2U01_0094394, partial [Trifolium medium]|nr:hypothetical protein [Trifolium medium]
TDLIPAPCAAFPAPRAAPQLFPSGLCAARRYARATRR